LTWSQEIRVEVPFAWLPRASKYSSQPACPTFLSMSSLPSLLLFYSRIVYFKEVFVEWLDFIDII
jgi:hypothetical protein